MLNLIHPDDRTVMSVLRTMGKGWWIAGGTPLRWYDNRPADSDLDIYFDSVHSFEHMQRAMLKLQETTSAWRLDQRAMAMLVDTRTETDNAETYRVRVKNHHTPDEDEYSIQLIKRTFYADAKELLADFDITVCQIATDGHRLWTSDDFARDMAHRRLRFNRVNENSGKRLIKYWIYGFQPDDATLARVCDQPTLALRSSDDY
jgi:hypothetical protein